MATFGGITPDTSHNINADTAASTAPDRQPPTVVSAHTSSGTIGSEGAVRPQRRRHAPKPMTSAAAKNRQAMAGTCHAVRERQHSAPATDTTR